MQKYTYTLWATQQQTNLTTSLLQDITFDGWDSTKLEDWLTDLELAADILKESQTCLAKANCCGLTCTLIHEVIKAEKILGQHQGQLWWTLCNANLHTYTSCFMEIKQRAMKPWQAIYTDLKQKPRGAVLTETLSSSASSLKAFGMHTTPQWRSMKRISRFYLKSSSLLTATLTSSTVKWCPVTTDFVCGKMGHIGHHCPDAQCTTGKNLATLPKTAPTKSLHWEHLATTTGHISGHITATTIKTDHSPLTTDTATEDTSTSHDHTTDPTVTKAVATTKDKQHTPHPTTTAVCIIL